MTTSYGVIEPTFSAGTSVTTLSGTYAGTGAAANATSLTLTITSSSATLGALIPRWVDVNVKDQNGTDLGTYTRVINAGGTIDLGTDIGLSITFGTGTVVQNATATFTVSNATPTDVDPNAAFDAGVNTRPRFDGGDVVSAGSFQVNGTTVSVLAADTINTVLARINSTVAGITASFAGDKVTIASTGPSEDTITLANDTSGFLTALNLSGASAVTGNVGDDQEALEDTTQFGTVTSGSFTINGVAINVDPTTQTLQSLISTINASAAGVSSRWPRRATPRTRSSWPTTPPASSPRWSSTARPPSSATSPTTSRRWRTRRGSRPWARGASSSTARPSSSMAPPTACRR
jgi:hypothetical protein